LQKGCGTFKDRDRKSQRTTYPDCCIVGQCLVLLDCKTSYRISRWYSYSPGPGAGVPPVTLAGSHGTRARPAGDSVPVAIRWQELAARAYNPLLGLIYIPSIEGCSSIQTVEQKDRDDQGGGAPSLKRASASPAVPSSLRTPPFTALSKLWTRPRAIPRRAFGLTTRTMLGRWRLPAISSSSAISMAHRIESRLQI
jgi:hypothetical protein